MNIKSSTTYMQMLCLGLSIDPPPPPHILHVSIDVHFFVNRAIGIRHTHAHYCSSRFDLHLCHSRPHTLNKCISHTQPRRALHDKRSLSLSLSQDTCVAFVKHLHRARTHKVYLGHSLGNYLPPALTTPSPHDISVYRL